MLCAAGGGKLLNNTWQQRSFTTKSGKGGGVGQFLCISIWICFDINNLEQFFLIITGIISFYLIKLMESLLAPDLEQVFHILLLGRQNLCLAPGTIAASWTVQVMKDC